MPAKPGTLATLGPEVIDWIEAHCVIPDGDRQGQPFILTGEQKRFVLRHYELDPAARADAGSLAFVHRRSQLVRPQKWGKGPLGAAVICAEAEGPVLFAGWDADGLPVGRPWSTPWIQLTAVSEDQTDNVWRSLLPMIQLGPLADIIPDTGETRIMLESGRPIEPVTASAISRLGQPITFALQDQTESWFKENGGHRLASNQRRNLAGMDGRSIETCNGWDPGERSVAQRTHESKSTDIYRDYPKPLPGSFANKRERRRCLVHAYGDSSTSSKPAGWVNLDRIDADCVEMIDAGDQAEAERFFGNRSEGGQSAAFNPEAWAELARPGLWVASRKKRELVTLGFDGARFHDATGLIGTHVELGWQWAAGGWESDGSDDWEIDAGDVDDAVTETFDTCDVWRMYADPPYWDEWVDVWRGKFGEKRVVPWWTMRRKPMAFALRAYRDSMTGETPAVTHDGDEMFARHIANARRRATLMKDEDGRFLWTIAKRAPDSPLKIDLAMAGCLSWEARGDAIAAGVLRRRKTKAAGF